MDKIAFKIAILLLFCIGCIGCGHALILKGTAKIQDVGLRSTVEKYYDLESTNSWNATYIMRTKSYQSTVPIEYYMDKMKKDNQGWRLIEIDVISTNKENDVINIKLRFREEYRKDNKRKIVVTEEDTSWIKVDGTWHTIMPGARGRLSLNFNIA